MSNIFVVGNLVGDPELRFTASGLAVATFTVCENRKRGDEESAHFFDVEVWRSTAENVCESLTKGMRVMVNGQLDQKHWETSQGDKRSKLEITGWNVGPDLTWATAQVVRNERQDCQ